MSGINVQTIGTILMIVGVIGLVVSFIFLSSWGAGWGSRRRTVVDRDGVLREDRYDDIDRAA